MTNVILSEGIYNASIEGYHSSKKDTNTCPSCYIASKVISDLSDPNEVSVILPDQIQNINYYELDHQVYHQVNQLSSYSRAPPFQV